MKRKIYLVISCVFAAVFIVSAAMLGITLSRYRQADLLYGDLHDRYVSANSQAEDDLALQAPISVDFDELLRQNSDVVGWLYCEDTSIDYPVVQSDDNDYYLRRDLNGKYIVSGTLFVDYRCPNAGEGQNLIIYGHNMRRGTAMFTTLAKYKDQDYYNEHPILYYLTPDRTYKIELFAGMITAADSEVYTPEFGDSESFKTFLQNIKAQSTFESDVSVTEEDQIVTLSTCSYEFGNARYVVFGKLK